MCNVTNRRNVSKLLNKVPGNYSVLLFSNEEMKTQELPPLECGQGFGHHNLITQAWQWEMEHTDIQHMTDWEGAKHTRQTGTDKEDEDTDIT